MKKRQEQQNHARVEEINKAYTTLQKTFQSLYSKAEKQQHKKAIKKLAKQRKAIAKQVAKYQKNPKLATRFSQQIRKHSEALLLIDKELSSPPKKEPSRAVETRQPVKEESNKEQISQATQPIGMKILPRSQKKGTILDTYDIEVDGAKVSVEIEKQDLGTHYNLVVPEISPPTAALLVDVRNELITITPVSMKELTDPKSLTFIKERFMQDATKLLQQKLPTIAKETEQFLIGRLMQDMVGLGDIEFLVNDPYLEEIVIVSAKEPIRVYSKKYGWLTTNITLGKEEDIVNYANIIARRVGRQINVLNPLLDAHLVSGDRINAVLYPINTKGNTITIRKFARDPYTIVDLINSKTADLETASLIWLAIEYEMNVIISGGTASGKTVFLNACMPFIPPSQRIISIEDTRELMLPDFLYWTPLTTRTPNPEGKGEVSMLHLLINSLRMRPDRIILGEMRKNEEAMVLFEAMHTGHSVYATLHADSPTETISRLVNPPLSVPPNLLKAVNLNVVMHRDRRRGVRRIAYLAEIEAGGNDAQANILYRWSAEQDTIVKHNDSSRFFEELNRHTGMSESEIKKNLVEKKKILSWLIKNNFRTLEDIGSAMHSYYKNKELLFKAMKKNDVEMLRITPKASVQKPAAKKTPEKKLGQKKAPVKQKKSAKPAKGET